MLTLYSDLLRAKLLEELMTSNDPRMGADELEKLANELLDVMVTPPTSIKVTLRRNGGMDIVNQIGKKHADLSFEPSVVEALRSHGPGRHVIELPEGMALWGTDLYYVVEGNLVEAYASKGRVLQVNADVILTIRRLLDSGNIHPGETIIVPVESAPKRS
jgi:hypothetical protein